MGGQLDDKKSYSRFTGDYCNQICTLRLVLHDEGVWWEHYHLDILHQKVSLNLSRPFVMFKNKLNITFYSTV